MSEVEAVCVGNIETAARHTVLGPNGRIAACSATSATIVDLSNGASAEDVQTSLHKIGPGGDHVCVRYDSTAKAFVSYQLKGNKVSRKVAQAGTAAAETGLVFPIPKGSSDVIALVGDGTHLAVVRKSGLLECTNIVAKTKAEHIAWKSCMLTSKPTAVANIKFVVANSRAMTNDVEGKDSVFLTVTENAGKVYPYLATISSSAATSRQLLQSPITLAVNESMEKVALDDTFVYIATTTKIHVFSHTAAAAAGGKVMEGAVTSIPLAELLPKNSKLMALEPSCTAGTALIAAVDPQSLAVHVLSVELNGALPTPKTLSVIPAITQGNVAPKLASIVPAVAAAEQAVVVVLQKRVLVLPDVAAVTTSVTRTTTGRKSEAAPATRESGVAAQTFAEGDATKATAASTSGFASTLLALSKKKSSTTPTNTATGAPSSDVSKSKTTLATSIVGYIVKGADVKSRNTIPPVVRDSQFYDSASSTHSILSGITNSNSGKKDSSPLAKSFAAYLNIATDIQATTVVLACKHVATAGTATNLVSDLAQIVTSVDSFQGNVPAAVRSLFAGDVAVAAAIVDALYVVLLHCLREGALTTAALTARVIDGLIVGLHSEGIISRHIGVEKAKTIAHLLSVVGKHAMSEPGVNIGQLTANCGPQSQAKKEPSIVPNVAYGISTGYESRVRINTVNYHL